MHTAGPTALWYLTRGTGTVSLLLLTLSVALGVANVRRVRTAGVPRFVFDALHRNASLLALAFLAVHIVTSVVDAFAPLRLVDALVPFVAVYRPVWLGLGALASDVLVALVVTSLVRRRLGYRAWHAVHWLSYACWPLAVVHGLGTGSDTKTGWMLVITGGCALAVLLAVWVRIRAGWPDHLGIRASALATSIAAPLALAIWLPTGPLAAGWARRAGTPANLLSSGSATTRTASSGRPSSPASGSAGSSSGAGPGAPTAFTAQATGTVSQAQLASGLVEVALRLTLSGQSLSELVIRIDGQPLAGGGVAMSLSAVSLGTQAQPALYAGRVTALAGTTIQARVRGPLGTVDLVAALNVDQAGGRANGTVSVRPG